MTTRNDVLNYIEKLQNKDNSKIQPIFEIMVFENPNKETFINDKFLGYPDIGNYVDCGFFYDIDRPIKIMHDNTCDIHETCYNAGFIFCKFPGLYEVSSTQMRIYFVWDEDRKGFFEQEEPEIFKHIVY